MHPEGGPPAALPFGGRTFSPAADGARLATLLAAVWGLMRDGRWRTLGEIQESIGRGSEASISARLRDLRKAEFKAIYPCQDVERRRRGPAGNGLYEYRVS